MSESVNELNFSKVKNTGEFKLKFKEIVKHVANRYSIEMGSLIALLVIYIAPNAVLSSTLDLNYIKYLPPFSN